MLRFADMRKQNLRGTGMQRLLVAVGVLSIAALGCSQSETVGVTGTVRMKGEPVDKAEVCFNPKHGRMATGVTDASGRFSLSTGKPGDGAVPGEYTVSPCAEYPPGKPSE